MNISAATINPVYSGLANITRSSSPQTPSSASEPSIPAIVNPDNDNSKNISEPQSSANSSTNKEETSQTQQTVKNVNGHELTQEQLRVIEQLKQTDAEVRRHEMAHVAAGGRYVTSGANFTYQRGPDGRSYAVGGEVGIDTAPVPGDPQATIQKMRQVKSAALAPANPSAQDLKVASQATIQATQAMSDLMVIQAEEQAAKNEQKAFGNMQEASNAYEQVSNLPETDDSSIKIAV